MKKRQTAQVIRQEELAYGIRDLYLYAPDVAEEAAAGQFVNLYCADGAHLLPRPISLAGVEREKGLLRLVYRISGAGTQLFSRLREGDAVDLIGPLGQGFPLAEAEKKTVYLVGGGIGIPPLLETARELQQAGKAKTIAAVLGYRDKHTFLADELAAYGTVSIASEDGSAGTRGTVLDVLQAIPDLQAADTVLFACGPTPMLRALQTFAAERGMAAWLSLEERMACGVGACLACVCATKEIDEHSRVRNRRVCKEGPVFPAEEIVLG